MERSRQQERKGEVYREEALDGPVSFSTRTMGLWPHLKEGEVEEGEDSHGGQLLQALSGG